MRDMHNTVMMQNIGYCKKNGIKSVQYLFSLREDQEIKTKGEGSLFVIYADEEVHCSASDDDNQYSDIHGTSTRIILAGYGGRL